MRPFPALASVLVLSALALTSCGDDSKEAGGSDSGKPDVSASQPDAAGGGDGGGCSSVPSKEDVESIIGSKVLPVEDQGTVGCAYLGDGDNVGVYFVIDTDQFDIDNFDNPDPKFATMVEDPALPDGSFVQSGDFYAKKGDVLYKVIANVNGTTDDDPLAKELMIKWLALVS